MDELTLGQKIKDLRKKAGMSQLALELAIEASPGSMSRIENGNVNPTKETIIAIAKVLRLTDEQIASLFSLNVYSAFDVLDIVNNFSKEMDSDKAVQIAIDDISVKMNIRHISVLLLQGKILKGQFSNNNPNSTNAIKAIGMPFKSLKIKPPIEESLLLKSTYEGKAYQSDKLIDFAINAVPIEIAEYIQKKTNTKYTIVLPLHFKDKKLGCILFMKEETESYEEELPILWAFCRQLAIQIYKNDLIKKLKKTLESNFDLLKDLYE